MLLLSCPQTLVVNCTGSPHGESHQVPHISLKVTGVPIGGHWEMEGMSGLEPFFFGNKETASRTPVLDLAVCRGIEMAGVRETWAPLAS